MFSVKSNVYTSTQISKQTLQLRPKAPKADYFYQFFNQTKALSEPLSEQLSMHSLNFELVKKLAKDAFTLESNDDSSVVKLLSVNRTVEAAKKQNNDG